MMGAAPLEIWGGVECSIVRVGSSVRNQLQETGHYDRPEDIDLIAGLGIRTLRYPVSWEMVVRQRGVLDWEWTDDRLKRIRQAGISPIAGLLHHGSGPLWTHVLDPAFPGELADYAEQVARRYPWIEFYTPVNEPLTTARISGLYGLWHPHATDEGIFLRMVAAQCKAIAAAMKAVRRVRPDAKLIQTEDFGRTFATPLLLYQAEYENERRWLAIDLLLGKVGPGHRFYERLLAAGVSASELDQFASEPCVPDIIGIDYYLTSDRMLDHRTDLHPGEPVGGNGRQGYVDIAAVRSDLPPEETSLAARLDEVWKRYHLPIAVTELHNGCTRDEQLRWFVQGWKDASMAQRRGAYIRAVTSWSMFGASDWNSMLVRREGYYECGAFDARCSPPQSTIVAEAITSIARNGSFDHPVLDRPGWWLPDTGIENSRPILISGFSHLVSVIEECCIRRRLRVLPIGTATNIDDLVKQHNAWAILGTSTVRGPKTFRLSCRLVAGGEINREITDWNEHTSEINRFLDLVIDGRADSAEQSLWTSYQSNGDQSAQ